MKLKYGIINQEHYKGKLLILMKESNLSEIKGDADPDGLLWIKRYMHGEFSNPSDKDETNAKRAATTLSRFAYVCNKTIDARGKLTDMQIEQLENEAKAYVGEKDTHIFNEIAFTNVKDEDCGGKISNNNKILEWLKEDNNLSDLIERIKECRVDNQHLYVVIGGAKGYRDELCNMLFENGLSKEKNITLLTTYHYSRLCYKTLIKDIASGIM